MLSYSDTSDYDMAAPRALSLVHIHILLTLAEGDRHGYGIKQDVERQTDSRIRLGPGTLYENIQRLVAWGLIEKSAQARDGGAGDRARQYYRLTRDGWDVLRQEIGHLRRLLDRALASHRLRRAGTA
jgi:DNA-binding PadR family transcriptional regulator